MTTLAIAPMAALDALIVAGVRYKLTPLQTSSRIGMPNDKADRIWTDTAAAVMRAEQVLDRPLPAARGILRDVMNDGWARLAVAWPWPPVADQGDRL